MFFIRLFYQFSFSADQGLKAVDLFHQADGDKDDHLTRADLDAIFLHFDTNSEFSNMKINYINNMFCLKEKCFFFLF